jgi:hypothetical protein
MTPPANTKNFDQALRGDVAPPATGDGEGVDRLERAPPSKLTKERLFRAGRVSLRSREGWFTSWRWRRACLASR